MMTEIFKDTKGWYDKEGEEVIPRTFVMGDIHGAKRALDQCLERSNFHKRIDTLIQLGDVADGWSEVYECVEELLSIKNLIAIKGNHDDWFLDFFIHGEHGAKWLQGGIGTLKSYCNNTDSLWEHTIYGYRTSLSSVVIPGEHISFFKNQLSHYIDKENRCFIHGGFDRDYTLEESVMNGKSWYFYWDRELWKKALCHSDLQHIFRTKDNFKEIFIGHTSTTQWKTDKPMNAANIWNLDTGAGWDGKLTIMNLDTHEYFQSDNVKELYPEEKGRN